MSVTKSVSNLQAPRLITGSLAITVTANFMGSLQFGFNSGLPSNTRDIIMDFMNRTIFEREGSYPSQSLMADLWALMAAIFFFGGGIGSILNRWISGRTSRKANLLFIILLGIVSAALMFSSRSTKRWEFLLAGRFLIGVHSGLYSALVPVYLSEICPKEIRGAIGNFFPLGIATAVLIAQVLGFPRIGGTDDLWHVLYGLAIVPCLVQLILLPFCVESPRYLLKAKKDKETAARALQKLRQTPDVDSEMAELREEVDKAKKTMTLKELFAYPPYRRATTLAMLSHISLQLCGLHVVNIYSTYLFQKAAGLSREIATYATAAYGLVSVFVVIACIPLTETTGRRKLQLIGLGGVIFSTAMTTVSLTLGETHLEELKPVSVVFIQLFMVFFNLGPGRVPWLLVGELFAQEAKPVASSLTVLCNWWVAFAVAYSFSPLERLLGPYIFLPFCVITIVLSIYTYVFLPETKGRTIQEIVALFERPRDFKEGNQKFEEMNENSGLISK